MTAIQAMIRLHGFHIYKIRASVMEKKRNGDYKDVYRLDEKVIIGDQDHARAVYKNILNEVQTWSQYSKYSGLCELFEPHIFDNGELAYWPDNQNYLEQFKF